MKALVDEIIVPDGEGLVDDEHLRVDADRDGKGEPHDHAARVGSDGLVDEVADVGEVGDLVEPGADFPLGQPEDRAVEENILHAREVGIEARAQLEQRGDPTMDLDLAGAGRQGARDQLQEGGLAGAVGADNAEGFAAPHLEGAVTQGMKIPVVTIGPGLQSLARSEAGRDKTRQTLAEGGFQTGRGIIPDAISLRQMRDPNCDVARCHRRSGRARFG